MKYISIIIKTILMGLIVFCGIKYYKHLNPTTLAGFINNYSIIAPVAFIVICAIRPMFFFIPGFGLSIVAGILFGPVYGTLYVVIGGAFSTCVGFYFARWMGKSTVQRLYDSNKTLKKMDDWVKMYGKNAVLSMRFFNVPWDIVSYWAGCSNIGFKEFYMASLIPLVPISFLYTYFGSKIFFPHSRGFWISLLFMFVLGMIPFIKKKIQCKSGEN